MRVFAGCVVALCLIASPAMARANGDASSASPTSPAPAPNSANATPAAPAKPETVTTESDLQQLKDLVQAQAKQLQEQQQELNDQRTEMQTLKQRLDSSNSTPAGVIAAPVAAPSITAAIGPIVGASTAPAVNAAATSATPAPAQTKDQPALGPLATAHISLGAAVFADWSDYTNTGFGPQWYDNAYSEAPGNNGYNTFEVTRTYLNFIYSPNEYVSLRVTPDIYRQFDGNSGAIANGAGGQIGSTENGNLTLRLKYAYVDFNQLFKSPAFKADKITFGQTQQPLIDWEEGLSGYRYAYLMPWNYLSLSSTYVGARLHGPIMRNDKEYLDYDLGVFTLQSFHAFETSDKKQVMGRLSWYPFGTKVDRTGLGITAFEDYGYASGFPSTLKVAPVSRFAAFAHYQTADKAYQAVFEFDLGHNGVSTGNIFSGEAPVSGGAYGAFATLAGSALSGSTRQQGFNVFGHARLGKSQAYLFGLYSYWKPNLNFAGTNPLDFSRTVGGLSYHLTSHFDFAVGDENFHWLHPSATARPGGDTNAVAIWTQFNY